MRRAIVTSLLVAVVALAGSLSGAATGGIIVTQGSNFVPGDQTTAVKTPVLLVHGNDLLFANLDLIGHSVTSDKCAGATGTYPLPTPCPAGKVRLFNSGVKNSGQSGTVAGTAALAAGDYGFACSIHPDMRGLLTVAGP